MGSVAKKYPDTGGYEAAATASGNPGPGMEARVRGNDPPRGGRETLFFAPGIVGL